MESEWLAFLKDNHPHYYVQARKDLASANLEGCAQIEEEVEADGNAKLEAMLGWLRRISDRLGAEKAHDATREEGKSILLDVYADIQAAMEGNNDPLREAWGRAERAEAQQKKAETLSTAYLAAIDEIDKFFAPMTLSHSWVKVGLEAARAKMP